MTKNFSACRWLAISLFPIRFAFGTDATHPVSHPARENLEFVSFAHDPAGTTYVLFVWEQNERPGSERASVVVAYRADGSRNRNFGTRGVVLLPGQAFDIRLSPQRDPVVLSGILEPGKLGREIGRLQIYWLSPDGRLRTENTFPVESGLGQLDRGPTNQIQIFPSVDIDPQNRVTIVSGEGNYRDPHLFLRRTDTTGRRDPSFGAWGVESASLELPWGTERLYTYDVVAVAHGGIRVPIVYDTKGKLRVSLLDISEDGRKISDVFASGKFTYVDDGDRLVPAPTDRADLAYLYSETHRSDFVSTISIVRSARAHLARRVSRAGLGSILASEIKPAPLKAATGGRAYFVEKSAGEFLGVFALQPEGSIARVGTVPAPTGPIECGLLLEEVSRIRDGYVLFGPSPG